MNRYILSEATNDNHHQTIKFPAKKIGGLLDFDDAAFPSPPQLSKSILGIERVVLF